MHKSKWLLHWSFNFKLKELNRLKRQRSISYWKMIIQFSGDLKNLMRQKKPWFKLKQQSLTDVSLRKLSIGKYVSTIVMLTKNDNFCNWIECHMCEDYWLTNKQTHLDKYAMPLPKVILNALGQGKVFSTLDLCSNYH